MNDKQSYNNWLNNSNEYKAKENPHDEPMFKATNELMQDFNKQVKGYTKMLDENAKNGVKMDDKDIDKIFDKLDNSMKNIERMEREYEIEDNINHFDMNLLDNTLMDLQSNPSVCLIDGNIVKHSEQLNRFIEYITKNTFVNDDYLDKYEMIKSKLNTDLNIKELLIKIVYIIQGERFNPSYIYDNIRNGNFLDLLKNLKTSLQNK